MKDITDCCGNSCPSGDGEGYCCTIPIGQPHMQHENWDTWGRWTGNHRGVPNYTWPNEEWKEKESQEVTDWDLLPDADYGSGLMTWEELNKQR